MVPSLKHLKKLILVVFALVGFVLSSCNGNENQDDNTGIYSSITASCKLEKNYEGKDFFEEGIEEATQAGILGGFPVLGVKATVYDGSYHEVNSSEMAFHIAGSMAFKEAMRKANPVLLEPIMSVTVTFPEEYMGDVMGDLSSRRGQIRGMDDNYGAKEIKAFVPLSEMFGYASDLRSKTQGRGNYVMEPSHYVEVPKSIAEEVIKSRS